MILSQHNYSLGDCEAPALFPRQTPISFYLCSSTTAFGLQACQKYCNSKEIRAGFFHDWCLPNVRAILDFCSPEEEFC